MRKSLTLVRIVGTRPQFMQAAILRQEFTWRGHTEILVHTGQHYDDQLSQVFFDDLGLPAPGINLGLAQRVMGHRLAGCSRHSNGFSSTIPAMLWW